jgi:hypothetical protein
LKEKNFNSNLNYILPIVRKIESKIKKIIYSFNLRSRTFEIKALTTKDKEKFKKEGICFYYREKGYIVRDYLKN